MEHSVCHRRKDCRLCGSENLTEVLSLRATPPANAFVPDARVGRTQDVFPLDIFFCQDCAHVQLLDVVDPEVLFGDYVYLSGTSPAFVRHFETYAETIAARYLRELKGKLAVDIGSNDGTLLAQFQSLGMNVQGVDPAREIAQRATLAGIPTLSKFFTSTLAEELLGMHGPADVITANNVFAHADDLTDIVLGIEKLLAPDGVFVLEVSYLVDVYEKTLFDTIYHEHLAYHSVRPLQAFFTCHGLELIAAERVESHGGSLRAVAQKAGGPHPIEPSVAELVSLEASLGLHQAETMKKFGAKIHRLREELMGVLRTFKEAGQTIAGFGAPAKATTLMYHFDIGSDVIDFIVDDSPWKQGLFSPGMYIPVVPSEEIYSRKPDVVMILAWNFAQSIMRNHQRYLDQGGQFLVPLPKVEIIKQ